MQIPTHDEDGRKLEEWEIIERIAAQPSWFDDVFDAPEHTVNGSARDVLGMFTMRESRRDLPMAMPTSRDERPLAGEVRLITELLAKAEWGDPAAALKVVALLRRHVDGLEHEAVALARASGWSWKTIAQQLGVRKQTVHRRYAVDTPQPHNRRPPR